MAYCNIRRCICSILLPLDFSTIFFGFFSILVKKKDIYIIYRILDFWKLFFFFFSLFFFVSSGVHYADEWVDGYSISTVTVQYAIVIDMVVWWRGKLCTICMIRMYST